MFYINIWYFSVSISFSKIKNMKKHIYKTHDYYSSTIESLSLIWQKTLKKTTKILYEL